MKKQTLQFITGLSGLLVGGYMILALNNTRGLIPLIIGISILLWRF